MTSYSKLAQLYDDLMAVVDYQSWADYLHALVERFGAPGTVYWIWVVALGRLLLPCSRRAMNR